MMEITPESVRVLDRLVATFRGESAGQRPVSMLAETIEARISPAGDWLQFWL
jgi:hypothetical protein